MYPCDCQNIWSSWPLRDVMLHFMSSESLGLWITMFLWNHSWGHDHFKWSFYNCILIEIIWFIYKYIYVLYETLHAPVAVNLILKARVRSRMWEWVCLGAWVQTMVLAWYWSAKLSHEWGLLSAFWSSLSQAMQKCTYTTYSPRTSLTVF